MSELERLQRQMIQPDYGQELVRRRRDRLWAECSRLRREQRERDARKVRAFGKCPMCDQIFDHMDIDANGEACCAVCSWQGLVSVGEFRSEYPAQGKRSDQLAFSALVLLGLAVIGVATGLTVAIWNLL